MATATVKYFNGDEQLKTVWPVDNSKFFLLGGVKSKANYYDSFSRMVGAPASDTTKAVPVTRKIAYKKNPSLHTCDHRCRCATGSNCECSCGGKYHGIDA